MDPINPYQPYNQTLAPPMPQVGILRRSILSQIRVISILMIAHGSILLLIGFLFIACAFFLPSLLVAQNKALQQPGGPTSEQMNTLLLATYGVMGAAGVLPGMLQIFAGVSNLRLQGRVFGIIALLSGLLGLATCYCFPTSLGLCIYGLVIYLNESAVYAFALAAEGKTIDEIQQMAS